MTGLTRTDVAPVRDELRSQPFGRSMGWVAAGSGVAVAISGLAVLSGWALGIERLKNLSPGAVSMKPNAAAALALCGVALTVCVRRRRDSWPLAAITTALTMAAASIGALTLLEYATGSDLGIDQLFFGEIGRAVGTAGPGRMAIVTALGITLSACATALLPWARVLAEQLLAATVTVLAASALLGYAYGTDLTRPWGTNEVSAFTVGVLTLLGIGLLAARPHEGVIGALLADTPGALVARWLLALALVVLPILGALRLAGQRAGLYGPGAGVGIMVLASLLVLVLTVSWTATRLNALGKERSLALERLAQSDRRLRRALEHLLQVQENERRGLAIDLHDDALPTLSGIGLQLELARERCEAADTRSRLGRAEQELRAARIRLRHLMLDLLPDALEREGLAGALRHRLEQMAKLNAIDYELHDRFGIQPSAHAAAVLYRIAREALRNVTRHANAAVVRVELRRDDTLLTVTIADDGVGFQPSAPRPGHLGLSIMSARAELVGGGVRIDSQPGRGTVVAAWVPTNISGTLDTG